MITKVQTEEVCDECGSTNIGYDALVKKIDGELEIVSGPFDSCQCLNEYCQQNEPRVRSIPVQSLRYCDGKDCYYHGDKDMMTSKPVPQWMGKMLSPSGSYLFGPLKGLLLEPGLKNPVTKPEECQYWYCTNCKESN